MKALGTSGLGAWTIGARSRRLAESAALRASSPPESADEIAVAIVGRPNVGKSSLLNRLLKEERVLVSELPGTTRDAIDALLTWHRRRFRIVDTAGMRRPGRVRSGGAVELVSVAGAKQAIFDADVVALLIDAKEGADRSGCRDRRRGRPRRTRRRHRRQQVGPGEEPATRSSSRRSTTSCGAR